MASRSSSAQQRAKSPIEPVPTVSVGKRQRTLPSRTQTPLGIGAKIVEPPVSVTPRQYQSPRETRARRDEDSGLFASGHWVRDSAPVEKLPLPRGWILFVTVLSLALLPIVIGVSLCASRPAPDAPPTRSRVDAVPGAQPMTTAREEALVTPPSESATTPLHDGTKQTVPKSKNRRAPAHPQQFGVPKRAAPIGPLKAREP